jgi:hypothetical protein
MQRGEYPSIRVAKYVEVEVGTVQFSARPDVTGLAYTVPCIRTSENSYLPRTRVNNLFGECAGLSSLASSLLAGIGYGKDVL